MVRMRGIRVSVSGRGLSSCVYVASVTGTGSSSIETTSIMEG